MVKYVIECSEGQEQKLWWNAQKGEWKAPPPMPTDADAPEHFALYTQTERDALPQVPNGGAWRVFIDSARFQQVMERVANGEGLYFCYAKYRGGQGWHGTKGKGKGSAAEGPQVKLFYDADTAFVDLTKAAASIGDLRALEFSPDGGTNTSADPQELSSAWAEGRVVL